MSRWCAPSCWYRGKETWTRHFPQRHENALLWRAVLCCAVPCGVVRTTPRTATQTNRQTHSSTQPADNNPYVHAQRDHHRPLLSSLCLTMNDTTSSATASAGTKRPRPRGHESVSVSAATEDEEDKKEPGSVSKRPKPSSSSSRFRPFRVKVGSVVALRQIDGTQHSCVAAHHITSTTTNNNNNNNGQNHDATTSTTTSSSVPVLDVWIDPLLRLHQGRALLGHRIRCCFPKSVLQQHDIKNKNSTTTTPSVSTASTTRFVEGHVIGLLPTGRRQTPPTNNHETDDAAGAAGAAGVSDNANHTDSTRPCTVQLLVDRSVLTTCPYLRRIQDDDDAASFVSEKEQRRRQYEERVRGKDKVLVRVVLQGILQKKALLPSNELVAKWVVRRQIPVSAIAPSNKATTNDQQPMPSSSSMSTATTALPSSSSSSSSPRPNKKRKYLNNKSAQSPMLFRNNQAFVGNPQDEPSQQERNWRWMARHALPSTDVSLSFFYQVLAVIPCRQGQSLATVRLRPLILPECTKLVCSTTTSISHDNKSDRHAVLWDVHSVPSDNPIVLSVPIEETVIVYKSLIRGNDSTTSANSTVLGDKRLGMGGSVAITHSYAQGTGVLHPLPSTTTTTTTTNNNNNNSELASSLSLSSALVPNGPAAPCHRCGTQLTLSEQQKIHPVISLPLCKACLKSMKRQARTCVHLMSCQCRVCSQERAMRLDDSLVDNLLMTTTATTTSTSAVVMNKKNRTKNQDDTVAEIQKRYRNDNGVNECPSCRLLCPGGMECQDCHRKFHRFCLSWNNALLSNSKNKDGDQNETKNTQMDNALCRSCSTRRQKQKKDNCDTTSTTTTTGTHQNGKTDQDVENDYFASARRLLATAVPTDFDLDGSFWTLGVLQNNDYGVSNLYGPSHKPITTKSIRKATMNSSNSVKNGSKGGQQRRGKQAVSPKRRGNKATTAASSSPSPSSTKPSKRSLSKRKGKERFVPTCSRLLPYNSKTHRLEGLSKHHSESRPGIERVRNLRLADKDQKDTAPTDTKKTESRAARANQRRLMKDVAAFGAASMELDALAGREQHLRFDRSSIHAWGVFADEDITAGEMVVEYRGELIGNAMAEKREIQYEQAKIGSDYMFRIDHTSVCDATKQGNVARFINASCDPNCYTQIVTLSGTKRIVVYAKKDIVSGQELCYDYKFPIEYDADKRIPCHCGATECRGFMNWVSAHLLIFFSFRLYRIFVVPSWNVFPHMSPSLETQQPKDSLLLFQSQDKKYAITSKQGKDGQSSSSLLGQNNKTKALKQAASAVECGQAPK